MIDLGSIDFGDDFENSLQEEKSKTVEKKESEKPESIVDSLESSLSGLESDGSMSMSGGNKDDVDITGLSITGRKNIFMKKLKEREPRLFTNTGKKNFQSYARACPWQFKKVPVILTSEEKEEIDKIDKKQGSKSYDEHITYGSDPNKKYHYICPRFWCISDKKNKGMGRSLSLKQVNDGECGGWAAVIPKDAKKVGKGKRILEFTDDRYHRNSYRGPNKLIYQQHYPSFQSPDKHPDGLCVPCCYSTPTTHQDNKGNNYELSVEKGENKRNALVFKLDGNKLNSKQVVDLKKGRKIIKDAWDISEETEALYNSKWNEETQKIEDLDDLIEGKIGNENIKQKRKLPTMDRIINRDNCKSDKKINKNIQVTENKPLREVFPLKRKQTAFLNLSLQKFFNYNLLKNCFKSKSEMYLKDDSYCLLRLGVDKNRKTSFISCIALVYEKYMIQRESRISEAEKFVKLNKFISTDKTKSYISFIKLIIKKITLDTFIKMQNGALIDIFSENKKIKKVNLIKKYKKEKIFSLVKKMKKNGFEYLNYIAVAYENYISYLKNNSVEKTYEYIWDLICEPISSGGVLFDEGINLLILKNPLDSVTEKIELICPKSQYSKNIFLESRPSVILYSENGIYEIITLQKYLNQKLNILLFFKNELLEQYAPELKKFIKKITLLVNKQCGVKLSIPDRYRYKENHYLLDIAEVINSMDGIKINKQLMNKNSQVIALSVNVKMDGADFLLFVPTKPSKIYDTLPVVNVNEFPLSLDFDVTKKIMEYVYEKSQRKLLLKATTIIKNDRMIVGLLTITNQFVPVIPTIYDEIKYGDMEVIESETENEYNIDSDMLMNDKKDEERILATKKIILETKFYNAFRNVLKILLSETKNISNKKLLNNLIHENIDYMTKLENVKKFIYELMEDYIDYMDINTKNIDSINKISTCIKDTKENCSNNCFFTGETCKLRIPYKNLLNGKDNLNIYFSRISDELIRFPKIRNYIMIYNTYLSLNKLKYIVNDDEILLLEDVMIEEYFQNITIKQINNHIDIKKSYDIIQPTDVINYDFNYNMTDLIEGKEIFEEYKEERKDIDINRSIYENSMRNESKQCIKNKLEKKINLNKYKLLNDLDLNRFNVLEYRNSEICTFELFAYIVRVSYQKYVKIDEIKNVLIEKITEIKDNSMDDWMSFTRTFWNTNRIAIYKNINKIPIDVIVKNENYYMTEFEFILLARHYNINLVLINKNKFGILDSPVIFNETSSENCVVIIFNNYIFKSLADFKIKSKEMKIKRENVVPHTGALILNNTCLIKKEIVLDMLTKIDDRKIYNVENIENILKLSNKRYVELKESEKKNLSKKFIRKKKSAIERGVINGGFKIKKTKKKIVL